ncbi:hypothetical protein ED733_000270 [Metarhizium rileyi]|uniref:Uncharacterized protein n=1 Tax=Metarhizium rileyi (strain RCEF 4871) TaxID=1649241 RepID=A0A5C6FYN2_METRR|nr:hypothetical protein ED733_000270 [Metarhizium rileyi]
MAAIAGDGFKPWVWVWLSDMNGVIGLCVALALITAGYKLSTTKSSTATATATASESNPRAEAKEKDVMDYEPAEMVIEPLENFDWRATEPARYLPIKPVYHITMALQQDTPSNLITIDKDYLDRVTLRRRLIDEKGHAVHGYLPRGEESVAELYAYLLQDYLPVRYPTMFRLRPDGFENMVTGKTFPTQPPRDADVALRSLGETVEEDLFLLHETPEGHMCVAFMCCFPSGFDPSQKFGNLLKDIHTPVPSYAKIGSSMERFFSKLQVGKGVKRLNWSVQTNSDLYTLGNHIKEDETEVTPEDSIDVNQTYFRVELQTLTRLPKTRAVLFSFKTYLYSIRQIKEQGSGPELADAIEGLKTGNAPVTSDERERYTEIIDDILATADLETISRKKVRQALEGRLGGKDLNEQKEAIKRLIEARFDAVSGADADAPEPSPHKRSNGVSGNDETDPSASPEPAKKKVKRSSPSEDADARLAAQLQAQENSLARGRTTRGGGDRTVKKRKAPRKKSAKKVRDDDESDANGSGDSGVKKRKAGGGFQKPFNLSTTLSDICGETQLSRPQVVKRLWEHIKANDLQDPADKRQIRCDAKMQAVFKQARVDMFKMNKEIGNHLYPVGEE